MPLSAGSRIGRYEIVSLLGAGGMGEVYRARDDKLDREVAIKVLPASLAADSERLARFEREAKILASLNHPNIAQIYEIADWDGAPALILELIDGETLEDRLAIGAARPRASSASQRDSGSGPKPRADSPKPDSTKRLPIPEALRIALQIADALEAAHERGVIHRDLKPGNIKLTASGIVKLLDFGLAKPRADADPDTMTHSPTRAFNATSAGAILGTVSYMSPEQARGLTVTKQSDLWAFGCVLYEMLTGRPPFSGETSTDIIVSIIERQPDWDALPVDTPSSIRRLLQRCLEKEQRRRIHDIGDARLDIDDAFSRPDEPARARAIARADVQFCRLTDFSGHKESPAISPDGKMVAFVAMVDGRRQIWVQMIAGGSALQVTRDGMDHEQPRWTPDSSTLIYFARSRAVSGEGSIWQISALGGPPRRIVSAIGGGDISRDGKRIAIFQNSDAGIDLVAVERDGSNKTTLAQLAADNVYHRPRWSPDGQTIACQVGSIEAFELRLEVIAVDSSQRWEIARGSNLQGFTWRHDGSGLIYASSLGSTLLYPPIFNLRTVDRDGTNDHQLTFGDTSYVEPDVQNAGALVACRSMSDSDIWRFPVTGSPAENTARGTRITRQNGQIQTPSVSPDGSEIVYLSDNGGHANLWVCATDGTNARQITYDHEPDVAVGVPFWSPSGEWIVFIVSRAFQTGLALIRPDGSDRRGIGPPRAWHATWSNDGQWLFYSTPGESGLRQEKVHVKTGETTVVYEQMAGGIITHGDEVTFIFNRLTLPRLFGKWSGESELVRLRPNGSLESVAQIAGARIPVLPLLFAPTISPNGEQVAFPLMDGATTNIWALTTSGGPLHPLTDFGTRPILIARSISWSPDSQSLYAAVAEVETDIVLLGGLGT